MQTLLITLGIAFVVIALALAALAIGWLITGKSKIRLGRCGRAPDQGKCDDKEVSCSLCEKGKEKEDEEEKPKDGQ